MGSPGSTTRVSGRSFPRTDRECHCRRTDRTRRRGAVRTAGLRPARRRRELRRRVAPARVLWSDRDGPARRHRTDHRLTREPRAPILVATRASAGSENPTGDMDRPAGESRPDLRRYYLSVWAEEGVGLCQIVSGIDTDRSSGRRGLVSMWRRHRMTIGAPGRSSQCGDRTCFERTGAHRTTERTTTAIQSETTIERSEIMIEPHETDDGLGGPETYGC